MRFISKTTIGDYFVTAEFEKYIYVWHIEKGLIAKFETDLISGMEKAVSISEDGKFLIIAGYSNNSITVFDITNIKILWQRKDLKKPAKVVLLNKSKNLIFVDTENKGSYLLNIITGETVEKLKGIEFIYESNYDEINFNQKSLKLDIENRLDRKILKSLTYKSFAILDVCFSYDEIYIAYSKKPLESISLKTFETKWSIEVTGHFLKIEYCKELNKLFGIRWEYENGSPMYLCHINLENGIIEKETDLGNPIAIEFLKSGSMLITTDGKLISTITNELIKQFEF